MKERPILFNAQMVRAILSGSKTQTRRIVKPQPNAVHDGEPYWYIGGYRVWGYRPAAAVPLRAGGNPLPCPYGQVGDRLWVREAWARDDEDGALMYRADLGRDPCADLWEQGRLEGVPRYRWRPSIHMQRWACRINLQITDVRIERVQDISRGDAMAEGCPFSNMAAGPDPRQWYSDLWKQINGPASWEPNHWVWVVEFRRA